MCARADTLDGPTLVSSLCVDRFVGIAVKATGVRQHRKKYKKKIKKQGFLVD